MVKLVVSAFLLLMVMMQSARADTDGPLAEAMRKDPARFQAMAEDVIAGYGGPSGLTPAGIEDHVALERAAARASAMRRFLAMDLNNDGAVERAELAVILRAASATSRGRLERQFAAADSDRDDRVSASEIRAEGQAAALRALTEAEAAILRALMTLDADKDGALRADEFRMAVKLLDEVT
ncbi:hypothetical protein EI545_17375 [Tabrizicola piscis]|uniref:EF-hand domain-containing protein n=1 Tax=Tabrizicola piscis TaxID=2494374 RepID=A0A3S8UA36_9RHOB|nr:hypothetical protein [Tabrizicola piscis]AZL60438.1 hypothetical protein EI545_17375 [Tabrizicola piscis]